VQTRVRIAGADAKGAAAHYLRPADLLRCKPPKSGEVAISLGKAVSIRAGALSFELPVENLTPAICAETQRAAQWAPPEELRFMRGTDASSLLPRADFAWLESARSRDISRGALMYVSTAPHALVTVNGHRLHRIMVERGLPAGLIPGEAWATALACAKAFGGKTIELAHGRVNSASAWQLTGAGPGYPGYSWTVTALDTAAIASFPDTAEVIPKTPSQSCDCSSAELHAALDACAAICPKGNLRGSPTLARDGMCLHVSASTPDGAAVNVCVPAKWTGEARISALTPKNNAAPIPQGWTGAIVPTATPPAPAFNPFYLRDAIDGAEGSVTLSADWNEYAPLRIDYGERTAVIMPTRK
jgi:hypothetical protein